MILVIYFLGVFFSWGFVKSFIAALFWPIGIPVMIGANIRRIYFNE